MNENMYAVLDGSIYAKWNPENRTLHLTSQNNRGLIIRALYLNKGAVANFLSFLNDSTPSYRALNDNTRIEYRSWDKLLRLYKIAKDGDIDMSSNIYLNAKAITQLLNLIVEVIAL
jgi:hypothetical protein